MENSVSIDMLQREAQLACNRIYDYPEASRHEEDRLSTALQSLDQLRDTWKRCFTLKWNFAAQSLGQDHIKSVKRAIYASDIRVTTCLLTAGEDVGSRILVWPALRVSSDPAWLLGSPQI